MGVTVHSSHLTFESSEVFLSLSDLDHSGTTGEETHDESLTFSDGFHGKVVFDNIGVVKSFSSGSFSSSGFDLLVS